MRRIVLGGGVAALAVTAFLAFRHEGNKAAQATLDQALGNLPPGYAATHGKTAVDALAGDVTVRDFTLSRAGLPVWSASRIEMSGADRQALRDVFDPSAYPGGHPAWTDRRRLFSHFEADDVVIPLDDPKLQPAHIKRVSVDQLSGHPFSLPPTPENRQKQAFWADVALSLAASAASAENSSLANVAAPAGAPTDHAETGSVTLADYDTGKLGKFEIKDLALQTTETSKTEKPISFALAGLAMTAIDARQSLRLLQAGNPDRQARIAGVHGGHIVLERMRLAVTGGPLIAMDSLRGAESVGADGGSSGTLAARGIDFSVHEMARDADTQAMIQALGSEHLVFDIDGAGSMSQGGDRLSLDRYDYDFHDLGTLRLSAALSALPTGDQLQPDASAIQKAAAYGQIKVDRFTVAWEDRGLTNKLIAYTAQKSGTTSDTIRARLALPLVSLAMMMPDQPDAAEQVGAFLHDPKTLRISAAPPLPVSLMDVAQAPMPQRAHLLGLNVKGE